MEGTARKRVPMKAHGEGAILYENAQADVNGPQ